MKKYIKLFISLIFTLFFLLLSYKNIEKLDVQAIKDFSFQYKFIFLSIMSFILALFFRGLAWSRGLDHNLSTKRAFQGVLVGMAANMVMPFRMGEVAKTALLSSQHDVRKKNTGKHQLKDYYIVGVNIVLERLMDVLILGALLLMTIFFVEFSGDFEIKMQWVMKLGLLGFAFLALLIFTFHYLKKRPHFHNKWLEKFYEWTSNVIILSSPWSAIKVLFYLVLSWASVYLSTLLGLLAINLPLSTALTASLVVLVLVNFAILLPTAPGGIGAFQFACVYGLGFFNIDEVSTFVASILLHLVQYMAALPLGLIGFILWRTAHEKNK